MAEAGPQNDIVDRLGLMYLRGGLGVTRLMQIPRTP